MSDRRRLLLMAALNNGVWLPYSYEYLYNDLIPTDINGGEVKNKARVSKVYANGVIENQLVQNGNFEDTSHWGTTGVSISATNNILTVSITSTPTSIASNRINQNVSIITNHKYLVSISIKAPYNTDIRTFMTNNFDVIGNAKSNTWTLLSKIYTGIASTSSGNIYFDCYNQSSYQINDTMQVKDYIIIDLTQMFPFDTPTTLTDNRVQELLNRGYIPYNTGTYKGTDIGIVSSEPYNLLGLDRTAGTLNGGSYTQGNSQDFEDNKYYAGLSVNDYVHQTAISYVNISGSTISFKSNSLAYGVALPIRVIAGQTYTLEIGSSTNANSSLCIVWYDQNGNYISNFLSSTIEGAVAPNNAYWCVILLRVNADGAEATFTNIALHRTGTRTGYAEHETLTPITFKYQGNGAGTSHDTYEITKTEHVFTKNMSTETYMSSFTWTAGSESRWFAYVSQINNMYRWVDNTAPANMLCSRYPTVKADSVGSSTGFNTIYQSGGLLFIKDSSITQASDITGKLTYQLATTQVIRIPRKHLGIVDLGSLEWVKVGINLFKAIIPNAKGTSANTIYISNYMLNTSGWDSEANLQDKQYSYKQWTTNHDLLIKDSRCELANDFISVIQGIYAWFETDTEVADINNIVAIESGGMITSDSEVLPNVDFDIKCKKPQQTGALGTWIFNNTIDITDMLDKTIDINFTCNNVSYTSMQFFSEYDDDMWLYYGYYGNTMVYGSTSATGSLLNANYNTITITGGTDATTPSFIAWLEANATKQ